MFDDEVFEFDVCLNWEMGGEKRHVVSKLKCLNVQMFEFLKRPVRRKISKDMLLQ